MTGRMQRYVPDRSGGQIVPMRPERGIFYLISFAQMWIKEPVL